LFIFVRGKIIELLAFKSIVGITIHKFQDRTFRSTLFEEDFHDELATNSGTSNVLCQSTWVNFIIPSKLEPVFYFAKVQMKSVCAHHGGKKTTKIIKNRFQLWREYKPFLADSGFALQ